MNTHKQLFNMFILHMLFQMTIHTHVYVLIHHTCFMVLMSFSFPGNLITDATIDYHATFAHPNDTWAPAAIAIVNGGGIRSSIALGNRFSKTLHPYCLVLVKPRKPSKIDSKVFDRDVKPQTNQKLGKFLHLLCIAQTAGLKCMWQYTVQLGMIVWVS